MGKSLADLTAEIREINAALGWRPAEGGPGENTFGDYIALLHSEVSEALEAYRRWGLADMTKGLGSVYASQGLNGTPKPEGVGSELADVLIRLLDVTDAFGLPLFDMDSELGDVADLEVPGGASSFGELMAWLHFKIGAIGYEMHSEPELAFGVSIPHVLRALVTGARRSGVDLDAEYARKVAFNRTRSFRHGGRNL